MPIRCSYRNFRATEYMAAEGLAGFSDWHDERAGHPTGVAMAVADTMPAGAPGLGLISDVPQLASGTVAGVMSPHTRRLTCSS